MLHTSGSLSDVSFLSTTFSTSFHNFLNFLFSYQALAPGQRFKAAFHHSIESFRHIMICQILAHRPLPPGSYRVTVRAAGFGDTSADVSIPEDGSGAQQVRSEPPGSTPPGAGFRFRV